MEDKKNHTNEFINIDDYIDNVTENTLPVEDTIKGTIRPNIKLGDWGEGGSEYPDENLPSD